MREPMIVYPGTHVFGHSRRRVSNWLITFILHIGLLLASQIYPSHSRRRACRPFHHARARMLTKLLHVGVHIPSPPSRESWHHDKYVYITFHLSGTNLC